MSRSRTTGILILGILSLVDLAGPLLTDGDNPPMAVAVVGSVLGLISLVSIVLMYRANERAIIPLVICRVISALTAVPAFFIGGVPAGVIVLCVGIVVFTAIGVRLVTVAAAPVEAGAR